MLETNIDDMSGEIYSYLFPKLFATGALDVYLTNIIMKKNRPGIKLSVLANKEDVGLLEEIIFKETTTFGVRKYQVKRKALERKFFELESKWGNVTLKAAFKDGEMISYAPEYEDCKKIANDSAIPIREVYTEIKLLAKTELKN